MKLAYTQTEYRPPGNTVIRVDVFVPELETDPAGLECGLIHLTRQQYREYGGGEFGLTDDDYIDWWVTTSPGLAKAIRDGIARFDQLLAAHDAVHPNEWAMPD